MKCYYCGEELNKTSEQKKIDKREYDKQYRANNKEIIRIKKQEYNKTKAGRDTQKRNRNKRKAQHLEYCRSPEYKVYKKEYDQKYTAKKRYGEYWESSVLLNKIEQQIPNYEVKQQNNLINKRQKRKRNYEKFKREELKTNTLGNFKQC